MDDTRKKILSRLQNQCARREYCISDVRKKALKALDSPDTGTAEDIVNELVKDGYVDELRYSSAFARDKSSLSGWGPVKIKYALRAKGIPSAVIDSALCGIDSGRADEKLKRLLQAKMKSLRDDPQQRLKLLKYALSRGYEYDAVASAIESLSSGVMYQD